MILLKVRTFTLVVSILLLAGCYQQHSDDDLRTVPVTNNPHIVPHSGGGPLSMMGM